MCRDSTELLVRENIGLCFTEGQDRKIVAIRDLHKVFHYLGRVLKERLL